MPVPRYKLPWIIATYGALAELLRAGATVHVRIREGTMRLGNVVLPSD